MLQPWRRSWVRVQWQLRRRARVRSHRRRTWMGYRHHTHTAGSQVSSQLRLLSLTARSSRSGIVSMATRFALGTKIPWSG